MSTQPPAIRVENLSKSFLVHHGASSSYRTLRHEIAERAGEAMRRLLGRSRAGKGEVFWALRNVDFQVQPGEIVAILGRNGAGKSTLLKIISHISEPTSGRVRLRGRLGSLLEVGAGFNPELTGRENIFLNGILLGAKRAEILRRFDEIVAFSEIGPFLDTPVKFYSSGMYMRLAFSVASHLECDILAVDEVLTVGDASFQRKCFQRIQDTLSQQDRAVLLVSHDATTMSALCDKGLYLENGAVKYFGPIAEALTRYRGDWDEVTRCASHEWAGAAGDDDVRLLHTWTKSLDPDGVFQTSAPLEIGAEIEVLRPVENLIFGFRLFSEFDVELAYVLYDDQEPSPAEKVFPGRIRRTFVIPANTLAEGAYRVGFAVGLHMIRPIVLNTAGTLIFSLASAATGLGRRFRLPGRRGFTSLFRPAWGTPNTERLGQAAVLPQADHPRARCA